MSAFPPGDHYTMAHQRKVPPAPFPRCARTCTPLRRGENVGHSGGILLFKKTEYRGENIPFQCGRLQKVAAHVDSRHLRSCVFRLAPGILHKYNPLRTKTIRNLLFYPIFFVTVLQQQTCMFARTQSIYMSLSFTHSHSHSYTSR